MERKKSTVLAVLVATIIVVAVFSSFVINLFNQDNYQIGLPDLSSGTLENLPNDPETYTDGFVRVEITPETVQSVIAQTLSRPHSYYREIRIELWADAGTSSLTTARVWVDEGWTRSAVTAPGGKVQHNLVGEGKRWVWYDNDTAAVSFAADETVSDLVQRIPTYEDVLHLHQEDITATGYELYGDAECIFVEVEQEQLGTRERYWIAVSNGLLVAAERVDEEQVLYRMTVSHTESPAPLDSSFALPNGQVLHSVGED